MIISFDGSLYQPAERNIAIVSWGIKADSGRESVEIFGHRFGNVGQFTGMHEVFAFIESTMYAAPRVDSRREVSFYTDDETLAYASYQLNQPNDYCSKSYVNAIEKHLTRLHAIYSTDVIDTARLFLKESRFTKVRGHKTTIDNRRVDYLAAHARKVATEQNSNSTQPLPFADWIKLGYKYWTEGKQVKCIPPFAHEMPTMQSSSGNDTD